MKTLLSLGVVLILFSFVPSVHAQGDSNTCPEGSVCLNNPLGDQNMSPNKLIGNVINGVLGSVGAIALLMFVYGGFTWMLSAGNSQKVEKGKGILIWATIGLLVIFSAYAMVNFVFTDIIGGAAQ